MEVTVLVGANSKRYVAHKDFSHKTSGFFKDA